VDRFFVGFLDATPGAGTADEMRGSFASLKDDRVRLCRQFSARHIGGRCVSDWV